MSKTHRTGLTDLQLALIMPGLSAARRASYLPYLNAALLEFNIVGKEERALFLANLSHESQGLKRWRENLNYSAARLCAVWPKRFPTIFSAQPYAYSPMKLAVKVYGGRMGNVTPEDAMNFIGRAPMQLTGRDNYTGAAIDLKVDLLNHPELAEGVTVGFRIAGWFWTKRGCQRLAKSLTGQHGASEAATLLSITKRINGGTNGHDDRVALYWRALSVLNKTKAAIVAAEVVINAAPETQATVEFKAQPDGSTTATVNPPAQVTPTPEQEAAQVAAQHKAANIIDLAEKMPATAAVKVYKSIPARVQAIVVRLFSALMISLSAGSVWAWLGVVIFAALTIAAVYHHRQDLRRWMNLFFIKAGELIVGKDEALNA